MLFFLNFLDNLTLDSFFLVNFYISYQSFCFFFQLLDLLPEVLLVFYILYSLVTLFNDNGRSSFQYYRWLFFLIGLLGVMSLMPFSVSSDSVIIFGFVLINCWYTKVSKIILLILTLVFLCIIKARLILKDKLSCAIEFPTIIGFSLLFMFLLTSTYDFFGVYLALEGLSLTLYVLAGILNQSVISIESAIKYFALGAISSGIFLFGTCYLFGLVGSLDFLEVQLFLSGSVQNFALLVELKVSVLCIVLGLFFKLAVFPCHWWVADVYEGVWTPVTAFFAIVVKAAIFLFFFRLIYNVLFNILFILQPVFVFSSIGSMFVGAFGALKQVRIKRFIAYASISQVGFILLGIASCSLSGLIASIVYLFIYLVMSIIFFTIILSTEHLVTKKNIIYLSELYCFSIYSSKFAKYLTVVLFSMAGVPPLGGFVGKLLVYIVAIDAKLDPVVFLSLILSIINAYYYLNFIHYLWFVKFSVLKLYFFRISCFLNSLLDILVMFIVFFSGFFPFILNFATGLSLSCVWPFIF